MHTVHCTQDPTAGWLSQLKSPLKDNNKQQGVDPRNLINAHSKDCVMGIKTAAVTFPLCCSSARQWPTRTPPQPCLPGSGVINNRLASFGIINNKTIHCLRNAKVINSSLVRGARSSEGTAGATSKPKRKPKDEFFNASAAPCLEWCTTQVPQSVQC